MMNQKNSRRHALKKIAGGSLLLTAVSSLSARVEAAEQALGPELKGKINHSACRWCYEKIPFEDLCKAAKEIGLKSIELVYEQDWPTLKKYGLTCAMPWGGDLGIPKGFNYVENHDELVKKFEGIIPKVAQAGYDKIICFSGNRNGLSDEKGLENSAIGLKRLMKTAEKHKVTVVMELLNSKVDHKDYQADRTMWGVELCKRVGSDRFKLLYDIYHMQIMEGDVIRTIKEFHPYIAHYHTGGVPGRNEIDDTQELNYATIMKAIVATGYKGFVGQEFIPTRPQPLASLKQAVQICDV